MQEIIRGLPKEKAAKIAALMVKVTMFSGPLPHPDSLKDYNEAVPNGAERILAMAEKQTTHRHEMEKKVVTRQQNQSGWRQVLGFFLALVCLCVTTYLGYLGHDWLAGIIGTTTIIGLCTTFVLGKKYQALPPKE